MPLTDTAIRNAKARETPYKLADGEGMYLFVQTNGQKYWRLAYRIDGKQKTLALGIYGQVTLAEARAHRLDAKKLIKAGIDPVAHRRDTASQKRADSKNTFEAIAREWHETKKNGWDANHAVKILSSLQANVFPLLGARPIASIGAPDLLTVIRKVEARGALDMAARILQRCNKVFRYAIQTGRAAYNPAADLSGALKVPEQKHHAALGQTELPVFLRAISEYQGDIQTRLGLRLMALTFVRTGELRGARWAEIDFDAAEWRIPGERMKMREAHIVPLSRQALEVLRELKALTGSGLLVFPSAKGDGKTMSGNTLLYALYRLGYHGRATGHGFRTTASTILNEFSFNSDWIEMQLAHVEPNKVRGAYNQAKYLGERRRMMQFWADHLDGLEAGDNVVAGNFARVA